MDLEIILQGQCFVNNGKEIFALERKALIALLDPPCDGLWDTYGLCNGGTSSENLLG